MRIHEVQSHNVMPPQIYDDQIMVLPVPLSLNVWADLSVCAHVCVCTAMWRSGVDDDGGCLRRVLYFISWVRVSHGVQSLPVAANPASKLALGRPRLCLLRSGIKGGYHTRLAFSWVLGILTLAPMLAWQVLYFLNHLPSPWLFTWVLVGPKLRYSCAHSRHLTGRSLSPASVNSVLIHM